MDEWRQVVGYEGIYEVSDEGHVKRVYGGGHGTQVGRIQTWKPSHGGYHYAWLSRDGIKKRYAVHRIVAEAFISSPPFPEAVVNHIDGNKTNNHFSNLEWCSQGENARHAFRTGLKAPTDMHGVRNPRAKLTTADVAEIRALKGVLGARRIAEQFGVSRSAVQFIHQGKHWTDVPSHPEEWPEDLRVREFPEEVQS